MHKIQAVIFDMDGVIIDSEPLQSLSLSELLKEYGKIPLPHKNGLIQIPGDARIESIIEIMERHNIQDSIDNFKQRRTKIYEKILENKINPMQGFFEAISVFQKNNIRIALASSRRMKIIDLTLKNLGITHLFEVICSATEQIKHKPAPDIYLDAINKLKLKPNDCVAIEDSEIGVLAAHAAGMKIIAVPNKYTKHQDFSKANKIIDSLQNINMQLLYSV